MYDTFKLLRKLCAASGVSGNENEIRETIKELTSSYVTDSKIDCMGNLLLFISPRKNKAEKKLLFSVHMDEIGVISTYCDKNGFVRFAQIGGINPYKVVNQRILFENGVSGIIHNQDKDGFSDLTFDKLYIDIGASNDKDAYKKVPIGTAASFVSPLVREGRKVSGKALDNRAGCAAAILALQYISEQKKTEDLKCEVCIAFTVQEEVGARGAKILTGSFIPDYVVGVDVTPTGDTPESGFSDIKLGKGPAVKILDRSMISHPIVRNMIYESAANRNIDVQTEVLTYGGTDGGSLQNSADGLPVGALSIPLRYVHSAYEEAAISDIEQTATVIAGLCLDIN